MTPLVIPKRTVETKMKKQGSFRASQTPSESSDVSGPTKKAPKTTRPSQSKPPSSKVRSSINKAPPKSQMKVVDISYEASIQDPFPLGSSPTWRCESLSSRKLESKLPSIPFCLIKLSSVYPVGWTRLIHSISRFTRSFPQILYIPRYASPIVYPSGWPLTIGLLKRVGSVFRNSSIESRLWIAGIPVTRVNVSTS